MKLNKKTFMIAGAAFLLLQQPAAGQRKGTAGVTWMLRETR